MYLHSIDHLYFQASHPPGEERAAHRVARPAAAPRDRAKERAVREDLQRPHLAVQPNPDAGNYRNSHRVSAQWLILIRILQKGK